MYSVSLRNPTAVGFGRRGNVIQYLLDEVFAEYRECAVGDGFAYRSGNHCPDGVLRFAVAPSGCFGMLQECGQQRAFLRTENPLILHQRS